MATLNIPYAFTNGTIASAIEVNADFNAIKAFVESSLVHADGTVKAGTASIENGAITTSKLATATQNFLVPVGSIVMFGGSVAPTGWLLCDGTSTTGYAQLAAIVGANTPDLRGRFAIGDNASLTLLGTGGSTSISTSNLPSHTHGAGTLATTTNGEHTHSNSEYNMDSHLHYLNGRQTSSTSHTHTGDSTVAAGTTGASGTNVTLTSAGPTDGLGITIANGGSHSHSITGSTGSTGDGSAYYQPYLVVNYIIKHD